MWARQPGPCWPLWGFLSCLVLFHLGGGVEPWEEDEGWALPCSHLLPCWALSCSCGWVFLSVGGKPSGGAPQKSWVYGNLSVLERRRLYRSLKINREVCVALIKGRAGSLSPFQHALSVRFFCPGAPPALYKQLYVSLQSSCKWKKNYFCGVVWVCGHIVVEGEKGQFPYEVNYHGSNHVLS